MSEALRWVGARFARLTTNVVTRYPVAWPFFRRLIRTQFDLLAPHWDARRPPGHLAAYEAALAAIDSAPARALDLGTGTGAGAFAIAEHFPQTKVVGVDLAERMLELARAKTPATLEGRVEFRAADAAALPFPDGAFDLVALGNMIPFYDELARVTAPGGSVILAFTAGAQTPIYVPFEHLRDELEPREFIEFAEFSVGEGTALLARKRRAV